MRGDANSHLIDFDKDVAERLSAALKKILDDFIKDREQYVGVSYESFDDPKRIDKHITEERYLANLIKLINEDPQYGVPAITESSNKKRKLSQRSQRSQR